MSEPISHLGMAYRFALDNIEKTYPEFAPLYRAHYAEMKERLAADGITVGEFAPRLAAYFDANKKGHLLHYTLRTEFGEAIGYANLYVTDDMHNGEPISQEDTIFVRKDYRNGIGRKFSERILDDLRQRGTRRLHVMAATDPRIVKLWQRMGFKPVGVAMMYVFEGDANVRPGSPAGT